MTKADTTKKKEVPKARLPSRSYRTTDVVRAAFLAGSGKPASEIALHLGGTTTARIYALLNGYGIRALRTAGQEEVLLVRWSRKHHKRLAHLAREHEYTAESLAAALLMAAMDRPGIIEKVIHELRGEEDERKQ